jgi:predicted dehydrogenase
MADRQKLKVGIVGLGFGAEFIPIYQRHPESDMYALCDRDPDRLADLGDRFGIEARFTDYKEMLDDERIDVIHVTTPPQVHAEQSVQALRAGKHVGCTIPMALSVEDCKSVVDAQRETGLVYMMMETTIYAREFLYIQQLYENGDLGKVQFIRSSHQQDMTGWPSYWDGLPPFYNGTHAIAPTLALCRNEAEYVECLGSGTIFERMQNSYGSPFAVESAHIKFKDSDIGAEVTRHLWATAREYRESFDVYGSIRTFEWTQVAGEKHVMYLGEEPHRVNIPDFAQRLPEEIRPVTVGAVYSGEGEAATRAFVQGGGHGGSHPHLAHHLLMAVLGQEDSYPGAAQAANITCSGILAHDSALKGGQAVRLPDWTFVAGNTPKTVNLDQTKEPPWAGVPWTA